VNPSNPPAPRYQPIERSQLLLRTVDIEALIPASHPARSIWDLLGSLDLSRFETDIKSVAGRPGRNPWPPRLLISVWIYAYSRGIHSARELERQFAYEPALQWLAGLQVVNHHSLSDFRTAHGEALRELFVQVLGVLQTHQLVTLQRVMQDGTKIRANANKKSFAQADKLARALQEAREQVAALEERADQESSQRAQAARRRAVREREQRLAAAVEEVTRLQSEKRWDKDKPSQASGTDPDCQFMRNGDGGLAPSYNVQLVTDAAYGLIAGVGASKRPADEEELLPALDQLQQDAGDYPEQAVADNGYTTGLTVLGTAERGVEFFGSWSEAGPKRTNHGIDPAYAADQFHYDAASDEMICPEGRRLRLRNTSSVGAWARDYIYVATRTDCSSCPQRTLCTPRNKMEKHGRAVTRRIPCEEVTAFKQKMQTDDAKAIYKQRAPVAEFPNAWFKTKFNFTRFQTRGLRKVTAEATWAAITFNLQRLFQLMPNWRTALAIG